ncbi:uncharacterized protein TM35_000101530 [Trypanosoma theileri]|uniref:LSM domain-containing protein n=1 Tax=Trypanosoma theileri TaxID=67003 RepID=A0A1X0NYY2_9TRYP|nr:uncharacterized protein TM35_000101530 [Trypanosoma theileri]ORC89885.1 hypothetical protein TM35_000101530 [Trypanosoma theileri]
MDCVDTHRIPSVLAAGGAVLHALVRVELTNGILLTGRIVEFDPETMNMKLDAISDTAVRRLHHQTPPSSSSHGSSNSGSNNNNNNNSNSGGMKNTGKKNHTVELESDPVALRCISSIVVRGCHVRYLDFVNEEASGGRGLQELIAAVREVRPALA